MSLQGKVAVVTGGNSGIVLRYVAHPEALKEKVVALGDRFIGVQTNVSWIAELQKLFTTVVDAFGRVDIMVKNAGVKTRTSILVTTEERYKRVFSIDLKNALFVTRMAAQHTLTS